MEEKEYDPESRPIAKAVGALIGLISGLEKGEINKNEFIGQAKGVLTKRLVGTDIVMAEYYTHLYEEISEKNANLQRLSPLIDVVCCCLDVVRQYKDLGDTDLNFHPMARTVGEHPERLLGSVVDMLVGAQKAAFPWAAEARDINDSKDKEGDE